MENRNPDVYHTDANNLIPWDVSLGLSLVFVHSCTFGISALRLSQQ